MELLDIIIAAKIFGIKVINPEDFMELLIRFFFNFSVAVVIVRFIYYPITKRKEYLFTYLLFSVIIFFMCNLLSSAKISTGFALGLFAIFSIIRYRTDPIPIKEMTYLFVVIGISVVDALASKKVSYAELVFTNLTVIGFTFVLEKVWLTRHETRKSITYEKIDLIKPENHDKLMTDLRERTGLNIHRFEIGRIDFMRDSANIRIFYHEDEKVSAETEEYTRD